MKITRKNLQSLKNCHRVSFYCNEKNISTMDIHGSDGGSNISRFNIPSEVSAYGRSQQMNFVSASTGMDKYNFCPCYIGSVIEFLKVGDELELEWMAENNNGYLNESPNPSNGPLFLDILSMKVKRKEKVFLFCLDMRICPNNEVRMIRFN